MHIVRVKNDIQSDLVYSVFVNPDVSKSEHIFLGTDLFSVVCTS